MWHVHQAWLGPVLAAGIALVTGPSAATDQRSDATWPERLSGHGGPVRSIALEPGDGRVLTTSFDYTVILWSLDGAGARTVHRMVGHEAAANDARFVSGNRAVSVGDDGAVILWDLDSGALLAREDTGEDKMLSLVVSPDASRVATASWDRSVRLFEIGDKTLRETARLEGHRGSVNAVAFSSDGKIVYTAAYDGLIRAFDAGTGALHREVHAHGWGINVLLHFGEQGYLLFGALDGALAVLDPRTGEIVKELETHERPLLSLALSADGSRVASGGGDGRIQVFDAGSLERLEEYETSFGPVWGLALSENGSVALHAGLDDFVKVWHVTPRRPFEPADGVYPRRFQASRDLEPGERQFVRKCSVCHTLTPNDGNRAGPTLYGVFGRRAGTVPGYPYSKALRDAGLVWTEETISDLFDHGPDVVTPGSKMPIQRLKSPVERDALVAYLKKATAPQTGILPSAQGISTP